MMHATPIDTFLDVVQRTGTIDLKTFRRLTGVPVVQSAIIPFKSYRTSSFLREGLVVQAELRLPGAGYSPEMLPMIVLTVQQGCAGRAKVQQKYSPWHLVEVPHGHSVNEEAVWQRSETWGTASFGFAERDPGCLASLILEGTPAPAKERVPPPRHLRHAPRAIGTATREADGTLVLNLRTKQGGMGEAQFRYRPGDLEYDRIARHVGSIAPGRTVPVLPFERLRY